MKSIDQKQSFVSVKWDTIYWYLRESHQERKRITILCHGFGSHKDWMTYTTIADRLDGQWINSFRFDFMWCGESEWDFWTSTPEEYISLVMQAYNHVVGLGYDSISLMGVSLWWFSVLYAWALLQDKITCICTKCPCSDIQETQLASQGVDEIKLWKKTWYRNYTKWDWTTHQLWYQYYESGSKYNLYHVADKITAPTLIIHWTDDTIVSHTQSIKLAKQITDCSLELLSWANHSFSNKPEYFETSYQMFIDFIHQHW